MLPYLLLRSSHHLLQVPAPADGARNERTVQTGAGGAGLPSDAQPRNAQAPYAHALASAGSNLTSLSDRVKSLTERMVQLDQKQRRLHSETVTHAHSSAPRAPASPPRGEAAVGSVEGQRRSPQGSKPPQSSVAVQDEQRPGDIKSIIEAAVRPLVDATESMRKVRSLPPHRATLRSIYAMSTSTNH